MIQEEGFGHGEPFLSVDQASKRLKLDVEVVTALAEAGYLPAVRVGKRWRIPPPAFDELFARICRGEVPMDITPINGIILGCHPSVSDRTTRKRRAA